MESKSWGYHATATTLLGNFPERNMSHLKRTPFTPQSHPLQLVSQYTVDTVFHAQAQLNLHPLQFSKEQKKRKHLTQSISKCAGVLDLGLSCESPPATCHSVRVGKPCPSRP